MDDLDKYSLQAELFLQAYRWRQTLAALAPAARVIIFDKFVPEGGAIRLGSQCATLN